MPVELRQAALYWLAVPDPAAKSAGVLALAEAWRAGRLSLDADASLIRPSSASFVTTRCGLSVLSFGVR